MPIITEPKKLSMPQQVQKNKEDIESIFKIIDGLDATDNVVVVPDMSYILSADELKSVRQPVAFIVYDNKLFIKKKEENGNAYFDLVFSIALSTVVSFESEEIEVNLTNGALGITIATVNTYSVSEIDNKFATLTYVNNALAQKANLTGANFTGAITAPSIIQNMSGYTFGSVVNPNLTKEDVYAGVVINGNKLTLVYAFNITRTDTIGGTVVVGKFNVPSAIISKLYQTQIGTYNCLAFGKMVAIKGGNVFADQYYLISKNDNYNQITFQIQGALIDNLDLNEKYYMRIEQTFLLSDNLAQ